MRIIQLVTVFSSVAAAAPQLITGAPFATTLIARASSAASAMKVASPIISNGKDSPSTNYNVNFHAPAVTVTVTETVTATTTAYETTTTDYLTEIQTLPPVTITVTESASANPEATLPVSPMAIPKAKRFELYDVWTDEFETKFLKHLIAVMSGMFDAEQMQVLESSSKSDKLAVSPQKMTRKLLGAYELGLVIKRFFTRDRSDPDQMWDEPRQREFLLDFAMVLQKNMPRREWHTLRNHKIVGYGVNGAESEDPRIRAAWRLGSLIHASFPADLIVKSPFQAPSKIDVVKISHQDYVDEVNGIYGPYKTANVEVENGDLSMAEAEDASMVQNEDASMAENQDASKAEGENDDASTAQNEDTSKSEGENEDTPKTQDENEAAPKAENEAPPKPASKNDDPPKPSSDPNPNPPPTTAPPTIKSKPLDNPPSPNCLSTSTSGYGPGASEYGSGATVLSYSLSDSPNVMQPTKANFDGVLALAKDAFPQTAEGDTPIRITALPDGTIVAVALDPAYLRLNVWGR